MNEVYEEVLIRVHDRTDIECIGAALEPIGDRDAQAVRKCEIMAQAIGRELGYAFEEEKATKLLAHLTYVALMEMADTLEGKPRT